MIDVICGIDPGKTGAIAYLTLDGKIHSYYAMPFAEMVISKDLEKILTMPELKIKHIFLEHAQAGPGQGVCAMFNYGVTFGKTLSAIELNSMSFTLIKAIHWQRPLFIGVDKDLPPKEKAAIIAQRLWPNEVFPTGQKKSKPHDGIIDACLIAEWGRRTFCIN